MWNFLVQKFNNLPALNHFYFFSPKLQLRLWGGDDIGAAQNNKWIQNSFTCLANVSGLVGYCLFAKLVYRLNGDACWVLRVLPGPQTQLQPLFQARIQWAGRKYMMINKCLSPESWLQELREGQGVQMPAYANRLSVPLCMGKTETRSYSGLV